MKKLKLNLDDIKVESFETNPVAKKLGTINGADCAGINSGGGNGGGTNHPTCPNTCTPSCGGTCAGNTACNHNTCDSTCGMTACNPNTCDATCGISCDCTTWPSPDICTD